MKAGNLIGDFKGWMGTLLLVLIVGLAAGCKNQPAARTDQQIMSDVQAKIKGETALASQNIQVSVVNGIATLNGTVTDEASRALAANDSGNVSGVKTVVNNLTVQAASQTPAEPVQATSEPPVAPPSNTSAIAIRADTSAKTSKADRKHQGADNYHDAGTPASAPVRQSAEAAPPVQVPALPPAPPQPVVREVTIPAGTTIPVRITETLDTKTAQSNDAFHGALAADLGIQGIIALRHGSPVVGRIVDARDAAHFKGSALLSLELTEVQRGGQKIALVTQAYTKEGAGRGKNTAMKAGGGAALGAIVGAIAGGGKGAAIGSVAGAGAGTGINAVTRGEQVVVPSETLINFQLQSPVTLKVTIPPPGSESSDEPNEPQLQRH
jgi:hypothetical protein